MNKYEVLYVIDGTITDEAIEANVTKFEELVTKHGGEILNVDKWGKKNLAYPINYKTEGYYVLMDIKSAPEFPVELQRVMKISEEIIRYIVVSKIDKKPKVDKKARKAARLKAAKEEASN